MGGPWKEWARRGAGALRVLTGRQHRSLRVDSVIRVNDEVVLVDGWCEALARSSDYEMTVRCLGSGTEVAGPVPLLKKSRPDVAAALGTEATDYLGFVGCVVMTEQRPSELEFVGSDGERWLVPVPLPESLPEVALLLKGSTASADLASQVDAHVVPVVAHDNCALSQPQVSKLYEWPEGLSSASLNIVVPLFGNYRYLQNQLLALSSGQHDDVAITLVSDDPKITSSLLAWVRQWNAVYRLPVTLVAHDGNAGFAAACNTGARQIESDVTLLLNSDVLPSLEPCDWASRLVAPLEAGAAMSSPVLVYPDTSVQHAGMAMEPSQEFFRFDLPSHPWRGMPRSALPTEPYPAPLLSGAVLAIQTNTYMDLGGMPTRLGKGDFEDVALSVSARERGDLVVVPSVVWTHIEAASYDRSGESDVLLTLAKSRLFAAPRGTAAVGGAPDE